MKTMQILILVIVLSGIGLGLVVHSRATSQEGGIEEVKISGSLTYPSDRIPESVQVCALDVSNKEETCTDEQIASDDFVYKTGYELSLSPGTYQIYAVNQSIKAYYNSYMKEFAQQGEWPNYPSNDCENLGPTDLDTASYTGEDIAVGDWYYEQTCSGN